MSQQTIKRARPKYQVFVSSTYRDLHHERERVSWEILKARHIPAGMEAFPATDDRGWKIIERTVDASDYYILLLAGRYGAVDPTTGMSWTEREYRYARQKGIPVLAFLREASHITADKMEVEPTLQQRLQTLVAEVRTNHLCESWSAAEDLCGKVGAALRHQIEEDEDSGVPRLGWYRGDKVPSMELMEEFARVSSENASLRGELSKLTRGQASLELGELDGRHAGDRQVPLKARVGAGTPLSGERISWAFQFVVKNVGSGLAVNVVARFVFHEAGDCHFEDWLPENMRYTGGLPEANWYRGTDRPVYIERAFKEGNDFVVIQRIRAIGAGGDEVLIRMVPEFRFGPNDSVGGSRKFAVHYRLGAETAPPTDGQFTFEATVEPAPEVGEALLKPEAG